jgi:hypothetical protein
MHQCYHVAPTVGATLKLAMRTYLLVPFRRTANNKQVINHRLACTLIGIESWLLEYAATICERVGNVWDIAQKSTQGRPLWHIQTWETKNSSCQSVPVCSSRLITPWTHILLGRAGRPSVPHGSSSRCDNVWIPCLLNNFSAQAMNTCHGRLLACHAWSGHLQTTHGHVSAREACAFN